MHLMFNSVQVNRLAQFFAVVLGSMSILSTVTVAHADSFNLDAYNSLKTVAKIQKDQDIQQALQQVLGEHYPQFKQNFEDYHAPYMLANDKALYIEGEKKDHSSASAATIYNDGTVYAGIYQMKSKTTTFFGNDTLCAASSHPTMIKFGKNFKSLHKVETIKGKSWCATSANDVTDSSTTSKNMDANPALKPALKSEPVQNKPLLKQTTTKTNLPKAARHLSVTADQPEKPSTPKPHVKNSTTQADQRLASRYATPQQEGKITPRIADQIK